MENGEILIGAIFLVIGIVLILISLRKRKVCTEVTTAKVIDTQTSVNREKNYNSDGGYEINTSVSITPIYEYYVNGNKYIGKANSNKSVVTIGQEVQIHYNPNKPQEFYEGKNIMPIICGGICTVIGIVFLLI